MERNDWKIEDSKSGNEVCGYIYIYIYIYISEGKKCEAICLLSEGSQKDGLSLEEL